MYRRLNGTTRRAYVFYFPAHLCEESFILIHYSIPIIVALHSDLRPLAITLYQRPVSQNSLQFLRQVKLVRVRYSGVTNGLDIFRSRESQYAVAVAHRFQQGWVRSTHLGSMHVTISILLESAIVLTKNESRKNYSNMILFI